MASLLVELANLPEAARMAMGARGRDYVFANYDRDRLSARFLAILSDAVKL